MVMIHLQGRITESGELDIELPDGLPAGEVQVTIEVSSPEDFPWELRPWTEAELVELMKPTPMTGAEIVAWLQSEGGWADDGTSAADWVANVRRKERENSRW